MRTHLFPTDSTHLIPTNGTHSIPTNIASTSPTTGLVFWVRECGFGCFVNISAAECYLADTGYILCMASANER